MQFSKILILGPAVLFAANSYAQNFELIDGNANIAGEPNISQTQARGNWKAACEKWMAETKEQNKNDHVMILSCETPDCNSNEGIITCSSVAKYRIKTAGTLVRPEPAPVVQPVVQETIVTEAPPPVIVETIPAPRPGFIWIGGFWGWRSGRHFWYGGHWDHARPGYVYTQPHWVSHARGWRLDHGGWRR